MEKWAMFVDFILVAGMSLLALHILFLAKSKGPFTKKLLIVFFANAIFFLLYYYAFLHRSHILGGIAVFFGHGMGFLLGPMLYFLLLSLVVPKRRYIKSLFRRLIPFALVWLFLSVPLAISIATPYFSWFNDWYAGWESFINIAENVFFITYIVLTLRLHKRIGVAMRDSLSVDRSELNWYRHLLIGFAVIVVFDTLCTLYELYFPMIPWNIGTLVAFSMVLMYTYLGYKGMFQSQLLIPDFLLQDEAAIESPEPVSDAPAGKAPVRALDSYSANEIELLKKKLFDTLEQKKPYLNDSLSLVNLADELGITTKKLSELLNTHLNTTFYNIINDYRVAEVISRLDTQDAEKYTLIAIACDCGFQSKASFNRIFKQKTGYSPSNYRRQQAAVPQ